MTLATRQVKIRLLLLDVDGVLTDGRIPYDDGGVQTQVYHVRDGLGIRLLQAAGIEVGLITGRATSALHHRCRDLGIELIMDGIQNKLEALTSIRTKRKLPPEAVAFVGDDLPDLPIAGQVGLFIAVGDAHELLKKRADWTTRSFGGHGAVREVAEALLKAQGHWPRLLKERYDLK
ncbi:MAG: HAD hydrolase family protein [Desulfosarcinaceae bacterium]|jgi:3-deoxy-D-manno-octulosonate 8-phosphate phosphatase (KDO 8-P phosphatase)